MPCCMTSVFWVNLGYCSDIRPLRGIHGSCHLFVTLQRARYRMAKELQGGKAIGPSLHVPTQPLVYVNAAYVSPTVLTSRLAGGKTTVTLYPSSSLRITLPQAFPAAVSFVSEPSHTSFAPLPKPATTISSTATGRPNLPNLTSTSSSHPMHSPPYQDTPSRLEHRARRVYYPLCRVTVETQRRQRTP